MARASGDEATFPLVMEHQARESERNVCTRCNEHASKKKGYNCQPTWNATDDSRTTSRGRTPLINPPQLLRLQRGVPS